MEIDIGLFAETKLDTNQRLATKRLHDTARKISGVGTYKLEVNTTPVLAISELRFHFKMLKKMHHPHKCQDALEDSGDELFKEADHTFVELFVAHHLLTLEKRFVWTQTDEERFVWTQTDEERFVWTPTDKEPGRSFSEFQSLTNPSISILQLK
jgi:hypothetical protein